MKKQDEDENELIDDDEDYDDIVDSYTKKQIFTFKMKTECVNFY